MARLTAWILFLISSSSLLVADPQSDQSPVEAQPPRVLAPDLTDAGIGLADSGEQAEELEQRFESAPQPAAEVERLREQDARARAAQLQQEIKERHDRSLRDSLEEGERRIQRMREQAERHFQSAKEALQKRLAEDQEKSSERSQQVNDRLRQIARERLRESQQQPDKSDRPDKDSETAAAGSTTRTIPVADLLATLPGRRDPMFASPEDLMAALKAVTGADNWRHEGGMTINRRSLALTVLHRRDVVQRVHAQLDRFRTRSSGNMKITMRILLVPDNAEVGIARDRATLMSSDERTRIYEEYQGKVDGSDSRDYERQHTICNGDLLFVWTAAKIEMDAMHRGVSVVCEIASGDNAVTLTPIPFTDDERKVDWPVMTVAAGQSVAYELPIILLPTNNLDRDDVRAIAFVTVDAIAPQSP